MILTTTPNPCIHKIVTFHGDPDGRVVVRPVRSRWQIGGKGVNAARAAHRLGGAVKALTTHGGWAGRLLLDELAGEGIHVVPVEVEAETRMSTFICSVDTGAFREFLEHGGPVRVAEIERLKDAFLAALDEASLVTLNGSVPAAGLDEFFAWAVERARERSIPSFVDTYGPPAPRAAAAGPWLLKANRTEIEESYGVRIADDRARAAFARERFADGTTWVLVTDGARGSWLYGEGGSHRFLSPDVDERNPVGSGDAMLGAIAAAVDRGDDLVEAVRLGTAAGAANAARVGVCDFEASEVLDLLDAVEVTSSRFEAPSRA